MTLPASPPQYDVFISYSSVDKDAALRSKQALEAEGLTCFIDLERTREHASWPAVISSSLLASRTVLLVFSEASNASVWVESEMLMAREERKRLFGLRLRNVKPGDHLRLQVAPLQWQDGTSDEKLEHAISQLVQNIRSALDDETPFALLDNGNAAARHDEWYVPGLRPKELGAAVAEVLRSRILAVVAPPGFGKSTLIREIVETLRRQNPSLGGPVTGTVTGRANAHEILAGIEEFFGRPASVRTEEEMIARLCAQPYIVWVTGYDGTTTGSVNSLPALVAAVLRSKVETAHAYWLFEATAPLPGSTFRACELAALGHESLGRIIGKVGDGGGAFADPEKAIVEARGIPGRTVRLWQSGPRDVDAVDGEIEWFVRRLSPTEEQLLGLLCLGCSESPLGISVSLLERCLAGVRPDLSRRDVRAQVDDLLGRMETYRLARVVRLRPGVCDHLLDEIIPEGVALEIVWGVSPALIEYAAQTGQADLRARVQHDLEALLAQSAQDYGWDHVVHGLITGDLEPFFRSSFRSTHLHSLLHWIDGGGRSAQFGDQAPLLRALRLLRDILHGEVVDVEGEMGDGCSSELMQDVLATLNAQMQVQATRRKPRPDLRPLAFDPARTATTPDTEAELMSVAVLVYTHQKKLEEAASLLQSLLSRDDLSGCAREHVLSAALACLNRRKQMPPHLAGELPRVVELSSELLARSMAAGNLELACDALFYYARSQEFDDGRSRPEDVLRYEAALSFLASASGRLQRRLQILLTQGSVHRHYACRTDAVPWDDFRQHMEAGFLYYRRAFLSALAQENVTHMLNGANYMAEFCLKAMAAGYLTDEAARLVCMERTEEAVNNLSIVMTRLDGCELLPEDGGRFASSVEDYALLSYAAAVSDPQRPRPEREDAAARLAAAITNMRGVIQAQGQADRAKSIRRVLRSVGSVLSFVEHQCPMNQAVGLRTLDAPLSALLRDTKPGPKSKWQRSWNALKTIVDERTN